MISAEYWQARFEALEASLLAFGEGANEDIAKQYRRALMGIQSALRGWYELFADTNEVSFGDAKKILDKGELEEFHLTLEGYIAKAKDLNLSEEWQKKIKNAYIRIRVSRLEAIQLQLQQYVEELFSKQASTMNKTFEDIFRNSFYHTAFEVQKGLGVGSAFGGFDENKLDEVLSKPWAADGKNFSSRVWEHRTNLVNSLNLEMTQAVIRGDDYRTATNNIAKKMNVSMAAAGRLVMTESAFIASKAQQQCFQNLGVTEYQFIATLDSRTSEICRHMDLKVFKVSDFKPGTTAPPLHPHCRSCIAPYFEDEKDEERVARGKDGKTYKIPGDMSYKEWAKRNQVYEHENEKNSKKTADYAVDFEYISSAEYKKKFSKLPLPAEVQNKLYDKALDIFRHRSGSDYEDMYLIDLESGKVLAGQTKMEYFKALRPEERREGVSYNEEMFAAIRKHTEGSIVTIHNHPNSTPPSGGDFDSAFEHKYNCGIIISHDGSIYYYKLGKKKISGELFDLEVAKYRKRGYNEIEAYETALDDFKRDYGIGWMKL